MSTGRGACPLGVRTLYFDIDGTVVTGFGGEAKARLADGAFERAVRAAGVARLVCVGNVVAIHQALARHGQAPEPALLIQRVCQGALVDLAWLRGALTLVADPHERARHLVDAGDWGWIDDLAAHYCAAAGRADLHARESGRRILDCDPDGDGGDVLAWLAAWGERVGETQAGPNGVPPGT